MNLVFDSIALLDEKSEKTTNSEYVQASLGQLKPSLEELVKLLSDNDLAASEFLENIVSLSEKTSFAEKLIQVKGLVAQYDYDGALEIVNEMLCHEGGIENDGEAKQ